MRIREMTADDYDAVWALWMSCKNMGFNDLDDSRAGIGRYLRRNPTTCLAILAGHDGRRGYIYHLAVSEECRRQGVASALVERALEALRAEGIHKVALVAFKYNEAGNAFWEKLGFALRDDLNYRNRALSQMKRIDT